MTLEPAINDSGHWINPQWKPGMPGTFAVVIGVSEYPYLVGGKKSVPQAYGLPQLQVSALTAYRFFEWLNTRYHYPGTTLAGCWLLLAPTQAELELLPWDVKLHNLVPTIDACTQKIRAWAAQMEDLSGPVAKQSRAFFFFSGHGVETIHNQQVLLPYDYLAGKITNDAINTENIYKGLAPSPVCKQFFFIDACRNDHEELRKRKVEGRTILDEQSSHLTNKERCASLFYATGAANQTFQPPDPNQGISIYGQALLKGLDGDAIDSLAGVQDKKVTVFSLHRFVTDHVRAALGEDQPGTKHSGSVNPDSRLCDTEICYPREQQSTRTIELTVIVAAMKSNEAEKLFNGTLASEDQTVHRKLQRWKELQSGPFGIEFEQLKQRYQANRDDWQPYNLDDKIWEIVNRIINEIKEQVHGALPLITPRYFFKELFVNAQNHDELLVQIQQQPCLLIIDALSIFHPTVCEVLQAIQLPKFKHLAIMVLTPGGTYLAQQQQLYEMILDEAAHTAFDPQARIQNHRDHLCEFGIVDDVTLRRRLGMIIPHLSQQSEAHGDEHTKETMYEGTEPPKNIGGYMRYL